MGRGVDKIDLSWIVVSHQSRSDLAMLLPSLVEEFAALRRAELMTELFVVDNASRDGSAEVARRAAPEAHVMALPENRGYGAALCVAAALARGRWLACSNADLLIPAAGLSALPELLSDSAPDAAVLAPRMHDSDGSLQLSVGRHPTLLSLLTGLLRPRAARAFLPACRHRRGVVDWASGACLLFRADAFAAAGGFDMRFFLYYEDCDIALRLARGGLVTRYEPALTVVHRRPHHGRPREEAIEMKVRASRNEYFRLHRPWWEAAAVAALGELEPLLRWPAAGGLSMQTAERSDARARE